MKYRIGKKQERAILDENGHQVALFNKGFEHLAKQTCNILTKDNMRKKTKIFDELNNTIGNHMEGNATDSDLIEMAYKIDKYLLKNPHQHDLYILELFTHETIERIRNSNSDAEVRKLISIKLNN